MEEDILRNKILLIGPANAGKMELLRKITDERLISVENDFCEAFSWTIDTKYYSAAVEFWMIDSESIDSLSLKNISYTSTSNMANMRTQLGRHCEALLLIFDVAQQSSFEKLKSWSVFAEEFSPSVVLCVGHQDREQPTNSLDPLFNCSPHFIEDCNEWCIENGVEFVCVTPESSKNPPMEDSQENRFCEKIGIERIQEALQANLWPGMNYKTELRPRLKISSTESIHTPKDIPILGHFDVNIDHHQEQLINNHSNNEIDKKASNQHSNMIHSCEESKCLDELYSDRENPFLSLKQGHDSFTVFTDDLQWKEDENNSTECNEKGFEMHSEALESLEKVFSELNTLRERAKQLPDKERRELAAQVALELAKRIDNE